MYLYRESLKLLPAGTGSNARLMHTVCPIASPCTIFIDKAQGCMLWDVDGNQYIDYRLGYGPVILGHSYPRVVRAVNRAQKEGVVYALGNELEIELAKKLAQVLPSAEMTRFANSGTESTMAAVRIARGYTKKDKIIKFEGAFHGAHDYVLYSTDPPFTAPRKKPHPMSWGIPQGIANYVVIEDWNDFTAIEQTVRKHQHEIAAIICEPVMGNAGCIPPLKGYLKHLRELCHQHDILLIFDEVKTGFRLAMGGAQEVFKVTPDLTCFAKSLGNGYPIAGVTGSADIMDVIGPGKVVHGGTYSANPISLTAALATLDVLERRRVHDHLNRFGTKLMRGIDEVLNDARLPHVVQGFPSMFQFFFTRRDRITTYRELQDCDMTLYAKLHVELLKRGIMIDEDNEEVIFTSFAHRDRELRETLDAFQDAVHEIKKAPRSILKVRS
jgi:glutamate-1-semialdehyde 2,1-aminomutase